MSTDNYSFKQLQAIRDIAQVCHAANSGFCKTLGDDSHPSWEDLDDEVKNSAIEGVKFTIDNPSCTSEGQHNKWMETKISQGWVYGAVKDSEKKTHPSLVPYQDLSLTEKLKDTLFRSIVTSLKHLIDA